LRWRWGVHQAGCGSRVQGESAVSADGRLRGADRVHLGRGPRYLAHPVLMKLKEFGVDAGIINP